MAGKLYKNDIRLTNAFAEGHLACGKDVKNPHAEGTPEHDAWQDGYINGPASYAGVSHNSNVAKEHIADSSKLPKVNIAKKAAAKKPPRKG